jgi:hypothetical protein
VLALFIPMILVMLVTISTLCLKAMEFYSQNTILFVIDIFLIVLVMWMIVEGIIVFKIPWLSNTKSLCLSVYECVSV